MYTEESRESRYATSVPHRSSLVHIGDDSSQTTVIGVVLVLLVLLIILQAEGAGVIRV